MLDLPPHLQVGKEVLTYGRGVPPAEMMFGYPAVDVLPKSAVSDGVFFPVHHWSYPIFVVFLGWRDSLAFCGN